MKKEDIAASISNISDKYLMEAMVSITDTVTQNPNEVINMNTQKHFTLKRVAALTIAACLILALGITVYATNDSFASWFNGVFSGPHAQEDTYKQISADSMLPCTSNGATITPIAAIADNTMCYIRLKIDAPEGTVLNIPNEDNGYLQLNNGSYDLLVNKETGKRQFIVPYFISNFPGCTAKHMKAVDDYLAKYHWTPQQVQDFIPLAMTMGCAMYYCGVTPDGKPIQVNKGLAERRDQRNMLRRDRR